MKKVAKVIIDSSPDLQLDYLVPDALADSLELGSSVVVPCGRRFADGYVVGFSDKSRFPNLKEIKSISNSRPLLSACHIELARWMASYYCSPLGKVIQTMLPAAVRRSDKGHREQLAVRLVENWADIAASVKPTEKQQQIVDFLKTEGESLLSVLMDKTGVTSAPVKTLQRKGIVEIFTQQVGRNPSDNKTVLPSKPLDLMPEQADSLKLILEAMNEGNRTILLHGVTGSGKTEVYMQAIAEVRRLGRTAIVLVPEIALTPQTVWRFKARFGDRIAVLHSHLSEGERHDEWHRLNDGEADIVIGARSAVFAPVKKLGLIVVDEEHEHSYKQEDMPRYNARDIAVMRGHMEGCPVVLGSATPALESWHNARMGKYLLSSLTKRVDDKKMPAIRILDMRREAEAQGRPSVFSKDLIEAIRSRIERAEQTILFLNRRGFATSLTCPQCGFTAMCENCSVSLTYHRSDESLRCHICGSTRKVLNRCPSCNDPQFKYSGIGTQRIESIMGKLFPHARVQRMDSDMTTAKNSHDRILGAFRAGKIDIMIGTQMIAKGLHFPNVTLVGVIYADLSLHMPDFRASERTFQLIAQVAGRAGRGEQMGEVIVQTYTPHHTAIQSARELDYDGFCDQELEFRKELLYPPFSHLMCITLRCPSESKVSFCASALARELKKAFLNSAIISEAVPAPLSKAKSNYRYQVMLRAKSASKIASTVTKVMNSFNLPPKVQVSVDMDALSLL